MALSDIIAEYPVFDDSNQARFRHPFKQGDVIKGIGDRHGNFNGADDRRTRVHDAELDLSLHHQQDAEDLARHHERDHRKTAVVMLVLRPSAAGSGHTLLFDTRNRALFFDSNYGWFVDTARPAQGGNFADWYRRFYHATVYKGLFEHGRRQLVIWE